MNRSSATRAARLPVLACILFGGLAAPAKADDGLVPMPVIPAVNVEVPQVEVPAAVPPPAPAPVAAAAPAQAAATTAQSPASTGDITVIPPPSAPAHDSSQPAPAPAAAEPKATPDPAPAAVQPAAAAQPTTQYQNANTPSTVGGNNTTANATGSAHPQQPPTAPDAPPTWTWNWDWNCADASADDWQLQGPALDGTGPSAWIWNWVWNCAGGTGNTAISIRVLSPGDDGPVTQVNDSAGGIAPSPGPVLPPPPGPTTQPPVVIPAPPSVGPPPEPSLPAAALEDALPAFESPPLAQTRYRYDALPMDVAAEVVSDLAAPPSSSVAGEAALVAETIVPVVDRLVDKAVSPSPQPPPGLVDAADAVAAAVAVASGQTAGTLLRVLLPDPARRSSPSVARREREGLGVAGLHRHLSRPSLSLTAPATARPESVKPAPSKATSGGPRRPSIPIRIPDPFPAGAFGSSGGPDRMPQPPSGAALLAILLVAFSLSAPRIARVVPVSHDRPRVRPRPRRPEKPG
jgi:hypothetical protein